MPPTVVLEADIDLVEGRQLWQIGLHGRIPLSTVYWKAGSGLARLASGNWVRVRGAPLGHELGRLADLLGEREPDAVHEREGGWTVEYRLERLPLVDELEKHFSALHLEDDPHLRRTVSEAIAEARTLRAVLLLHISRRSSLIQAVDVDLRWGDVHGSARQMHVDIQPLEDQAPLAPDGAESNAVVEVSLGSLFFTLPGIGGWGGHSHGPWAQRAIDKIKLSESNLKPLDCNYDEIYNSGWFTQAYTESVSHSGTKAILGAHHPVVVGALNEDNSTALGPEYDAWFANDPAFQTNPGHYYSLSDYKRYFHHFGGDTTGLEDKWYFIFHGPPSTTVGDRFYSARDWGYGCGRINEDLNRLTFTRAIEQYHRYSKDGKRRAYLMMGHVLHLLQDVGEPDHAALADHAGSGMDEVEAYSEYHYCEFLATEAALAAAAACGPFALLCAVSTFAVTEAACWASASSRVMGYEKLIAEEWSIQNILGDIDAKPILKTSYDAAFHALSALAMQGAQSRGLSYALGTTTLALIPPVPNADPAIDADDAADTQPFYDLTNELAPEIIVRTAGLLEHFYDVANYPPFLERIMVVQFEPGQQPLRFGVLRENASRHCTRYEAHWIASGNGRKLHIIKKQHLALDYPAYVFLLFGPSDIFPERSKRMRNPTVRLTGNRPDFGPLNINVPLNEAVDSQLGPYYWGTFMVGNCGKDPYQLTLHVTGKDAGPHYNGRNPSGSEIDKDPATLARVDITTPDLRWTQYTPGEDTLHSMTVPIPVWDISVTPAGSFVLNTVLRRDEHVKVLDISQLSWDCHWEPFPGLITCDVLWELDSDVSVTTPRGTVSGPWADFGVEISLAPNPRGSGMLLRVVANHKSQPGHYTLTVRCAYSMHDRVIIVEWDVL